MGKFLAVSFLGGLATVMVVAAIREWFRLSSTRFVQVPGRVVTVAVVGAPSEFPEESHLTEYRVVVEFEFGWNGAVMRGQQPSVLVIKSTRKADLKRIAARYRVGDCPVFVNREDPVQAYLDNPASVRWLLVPLAGGSAIVLGGLAWIFWRVLE